MTSDKILHDIRDNVIGDFSRHHLVDKQDLANIKRSFGLDGDIIMTKIVCCHGLKIGSLLMKIQIYTTNFKYFNF